MGLGVVGGDSPTIRVIEFLIRNRNYDYSKADISRGARVSKPTLFKVWKTLEELGIVVETRKVGKARMYKLNEENPIVKKFIELDEVISRCLEEMRSEG